MSKSFDLTINFPVTGLDNIDKANSKLQQLGQSVDSTNQRILGMGPASSKTMASVLQAVNQAAQSASAASTQAAQQAASSATNAANSAAAAYQRLTTAINQANGAMRKTPTGGSGAGGGGNQGGGNQGGGSSGGSGGGHGSGSLFGNGQHPRIAIANMLGVGGAGLFGYTVLKHTAEAIKEIIENTTEGARQLQNFANSLGVSVRQAQQLSAAAKLSGVELGSLENSVRTLSSALEDPAGSGKKAADALRQLGIETVNLKGELKDPGQIAVELVKALGGIDDAAKRDALGVATLGRSFKELLPLVLNLKNVGNLDGFTDAFGDQTQKDLLIVHENLAKIGLTIQQIERNLVAGLAPALEAAAALFQKLQIPEATAKRFGKGEVGDVSRQSVDNPNWKYTGNSLGIRLNDPAYNAAKKGFEWGDLGYVQGKERYYKQQVAQDSTAIGQIYDSGKTPDKSLLEKYRADQAEAKKYADRLKDLQDGGKKAAHAADQFAEALAKVKTRVEELVDGNKGEVARIDEQTQAGIRRYKLKPFSRDWTDWVSQNGLLRADALGREQSRASSKLGPDGYPLGPHGSDLSAESLRLAMAKEFQGGITSGLKEGDPLSEYLFKGPRPTTLPPWFSAHETNSLMMTLAKGQNRLGSINSMPGGEGQQAAMNYNLSLREIQEEQRRAIAAAKELEEDKQLEAMEKARFDAARQGLEAVLNYEEQLANIRKQQLQETANFTKGLFNAALSGHGGVPNFFKSWGRGMADTVVGNFGMSTIGTLNSHLTLQKDLEHAGILGTPGKNGQFQTNFFGKLLSGTPFGIDPAKGGHVDPLQDATQKNTTATDKNNQAIDSNTQALGSLVGTLSKLGGFDAPPMPNMASKSAESLTSSTNNPSNSTLTPILSGVLKPIATGVVGIGKSIESGDPGSALKAAEQAISSIGGDAYSDRPKAPAHPVSYGDLPNLRAPQITLPGIPNTVPVQSSVPARNVDTSIFQKLEKVLGGPGGTTGFAGPVISNFQGNLLSAQETLSDDLTKPADPMLTSENRYGLGDLSHTSISDVWGPGPVDTSANAPKVPFTPPPTTAQNDATAATGIAGKLSQLLGGAKYAGSGYGLGGVLTGGMDLGNGQGVALSGTERVGLGLGIGAQAAGGTMAAISGFGKGGAQGVLQGIGGTMAAVAPFTGPAAPFLEAGAMVTGLISSLFPSGREKRSRQEEATLAHSAFIAPAARDYDFSTGGGGGFSLGMGSTLRNGGPSANYNITIPAMDAKSFADWANNNTQSLGQAVLAGISQGGIGSLDQEIAWRAQYGGQIPQGWG